MTRGRCLSLSAAAVPPSTNALPYCFGAPLREAAEPFRVAFAAQLPADSPLALEGALEAEARVAFADRRRRAPSNFEAVLACGLQRALEDAGWRARSVSLTVQLRGGASRPGTTIDVEGGSR